MPSRREAGRSILAGLVILWVTWGSQLALGATVEVNVTAALDLESTVVPEYGGDYPPRVTTSIEIQLPAVTVSGGDTLRVAVEFAGGQYFRRIAPPDGGYTRFSFDLFLKNEPVYPAAQFNGVEGGRRMQVFDRDRNLAFESPGSSFYLVEFSQKDIWGADFIAFGGGNAGEPLVPETGGKLVFEWPIPTGLPSHFMMPDPPAFGTRTFLNNTVTLVFGIDGPFGGSAGAAAAVAVPEPAAGSLCLAAFAARQVRRRRTDRRIPT